MSFGWVFSTFNVIVKTFVGPEDCVLLICAIWIIEPYVYVHMLNMKYWICDIVV